MIRDIDSRAAAMEANGSIPRKHHTVPRFYLERWSESGKIRMTDLDRPSNTMTPNPVNAAKRTDFYRVEEEILKRGSAFSWEVFLSVLEGKVAEITQQLLDEPDLQPEDLPIEVLGEIVWFVALQITRGVNFRRGLQWHRLQEFVIAYEKAGDAALRRRLEIAGFEVTDDRVDLARAQLEEMRKDPLKVPMMNALKIKISAQATSEIVKWISARRFVVYRTSVPRLVTSDEPVAPLAEFMGDPEAPLGIANAPVLVLPLSPSAILAMFNPGIHVRLDPNEPLTAADVLDLNQVVLGNAFAWGFERPSQSLTSKLYVPKLPEAGEREIVARTSAGAEVHRMTIGHRWRNDADAPVRPVARWWA